MAYWNRVIVFCFVGSLMLVSGCGSRGRRSIEATGAVTIDGTPIQVGQITFDVVVDGDLPSGASIANGKYRLMTTPGRKRVHVTALDPATLDNGGNDTVKPDAKPKMARDLVPEKYLKEPLEIEITQSGVYDIELSSR